MKATVTIMFLIFSITNCFANIEMENETKIKHAKGALITGITLTTVGALSLGASILFYSDAATRSDFDDIGKGISIFIGTIALGTGLAFEGTSILFYRYYYKKNRNLSFELNQKTDGLTLNILF